MSPSEIQSLLQLARDAARIAGDYLRDNTPSVDAHLGRDIKLHQDREAEQLILQHLHGSGIGVLAEESGGEALEGSEPRWIVDPLDGTYNYYRGLPECAVAIALWQQGARAGVIYDFNRDEMYSGAPGIGAQLNDAPMHASGETNVGNATLATGFPAGGDFSAETVAHRSAHWTQFRKVRMTGSAAIAIARVASGAYDAYMEYDIMPWDVYAGIALVEASGGSCLVTPASHRSGALNTIACGSTELSERLAQMQ